MKKLLLVSLLTLGLAFAVSADVNKPSQAIQDTELTPHGSQGGGAGSCSLIYYDICSGWIWIYSGWGAGDQIGVAFDLPAGCGKLAGEHCCNTGLWWYWRYTAPGYGFSVSYGLYNTDATLCLAGQTGGFAGLDPTERWNFTAGLGCVTSDVATITATWDKGTLPYAATDNNVSNSVGGPACAGVPINPPTSFAYYIAAGPTTYCPPAYFADALGPIEFLMDAGFVCGGTATEEASWGEIKSLFQ